jgi:hypothetical protein
MCGLIGMEQKGSIMSVFMAKGLLSRSDGPEELTRSYISSDFKIGFVFLMLYLFLFRALISQ